MDERETQVRQRMNALRIEKQKLEDTLVNNRLKRSSLKYNYPPNHGKVQRHTTDFGHVNPIDYIAPPSPSPTWFHHRPVYMPTMSSTIQRPFNQVAHSPYRPRRTMGFRRTGSRGRGRYSSHRRT
ncbi:hypothetical protein ACOME3_001966 [Neoechinorhynchus agilis]